jgi:hypothetical protein
MTVPIETAAIGCCDPALGTQASQMLGRALASSLSEHVARCLACQLERRAFERFDRASEAGGTSLPSNNS